ncbi:hypothetical protein PTKU64_93720 (plasmid) [Paraburkholderia terrae]|uniref:Uncharacterized protein n=1 Tax=Paraburkholderia terrae TaxID=311230 RepID=A0ABN6JXJ9_9BURK|nr:hypothetical protein PTKU64_93720 [Paraburkholderia terrae]
MRLRTDTLHAHVETFTSTRNAEIDDYFFSLDDVQRREENSRSKATQCNPHHAVLMMSALTFWLSSAMAGAGFGTSNLFGDLFVWSSVMLLLVSIAFDNE